jgi:poly [ADP-ribose] polymerase 10/14/15
MHVTACGADYDPTTMQRMLFHGTEAVEAIINSTDGHGFLPLLAGARNAAQFGNGVYFARDAKYSDQQKYARTIGNGQKQMLVAEVLEGKWTKGHRGMKKRPLLPGEKYKKYNSVVDVVVNPTIFVVQHSNEAYPAYLLTYH